MYILYFWGEELLRFAKNINYSYIAISGESPHRCIAIPETHFFVLYSDLTDLCNPTPARGGGGGVSHISSLCFTAR